ncbi:MAG TPA: acid phosphatase [Burkholderiales bacterium]|jgi:phospholipase C
MLPPRIEAPIERALPFATGLIAVALSACSTSPTASGLAGLERIDHLIVIYAENRSFDNLYGLFPGANGLANATPAQYVQVDHDGTTLPHLPPVWRGKRPDPAFPRDLPNRPFQIDAPPIDLALTQPTRDLIHDYYPQQEQIDGGRNDRFVEVSNAGALAMGYYDGSKLPMWKWAQEYTLADNFFMGAFGGSYLNHFWLICACTPADPAVPAAKRAQLEANGWLKRTARSPSSALDGPAVFTTGQFTPDGYSVGNQQAPYQPSGVPPARGGDPRYAGTSGYTLPPQTMKTIGDTLSAKGISWAWYAGGWNEALEDGMQDPAAKRRVIYNNEPGSPYFAVHHQPFNYFARFAPGTMDRAEHLKDYADLLAAIDRGELPQVTFYKPPGRFDQHPGNTDVMSGDIHISGLVAKIKASPLWASSVIIVTYDENGGFWDHVPPPKGDRWGPGTRIPAMIISPFARRGYVDHAYYDTTSILKLITRRFGLEPLPGVRDAAGDLTGALDLGG